MAKKSVIARNIKRQQLVDKYYTVRQELKKTIIDPNQSYEARKKASEKLASLPRNSSPIRLRNRCALTGRPRGVYRKFGLCRHMIRNYAMLGQIPGLLKSSW